MANQYEVKAGDTLYKIAHHNNISLTELLNLNSQISNPNLIQVGDLINLPDSNDHGTDVDPEDLDTMARTIYGEARGESELGQIAVGWVILNRLAKQTWYGKDVTGVCLKPYQFSCWNHSDINECKVKLVKSSDPEFQKCLKSARKVLTSSVSDPTGGATHYHATSVSPFWIHGATLTKTIGGHVFYKNVD
jgi:N-acetylmuramoyl-L-alanine amidase